mmetsp:Transcript_23479/g.79264  ORF Transcript_23479/g.79264 Transcript_23479/m.79264 type:complete len:215 (-) Transcript_23479:394-1038(-)
MMHSSTNQRVSEPSLSLAATTAAVSAVRACRGLGLQHSAVMGAGASAPARSAVLTATSLRTRSISSCSTSIRSSSSTASASSRPVCRTSAAQAPARRARRRPSPSAPAAASSSCSLKLRATTESVELAQYGSTATSSSSSSSSAPLTRWLSLRRRLRPGALSTTPASDDHNASRWSRTSSTTSDSSEGVGRHALLRAESARTSEIFSSRLLPAR